MIKYLLSVLLLIPLLYGSYCYYIDPMFEYTVEFKIRDINRKIGYTSKRRGIIHDYIIRNSIEACENEEGLHYIVDNSIIFNQFFGDDYPCSSKYIARCQSGKDINIDSHTGYCFIGEAQLNESIEVIND